MNIKKSVIPAFRLRNVLSILFWVLIITSSQAQYFKTRFSYDETTGQLSFFIKPTVASLSTDIGSFQFDVTYPIGFNINFGSVTNNTTTFPGLNVVETNLFTLNNEWVKRWEHQGLISSQTYDLNTEYFVFSVSVNGSGTSTLNYKSDYPNFDPVFTVNSDDGTPLWDNTAPYDIYYPTQLQSGQIVYMTLGITLPIELDYFDTHVNNNSISLNWTTRSEQNLYGFDIEKSFDGLMFSKIGFKKSKGGIALTNYDFEDNNTIYNKQMYYRLKITDLDGHYEYSEIKIVQLPNKNSNINITYIPMSKIVNIWSSEDINDILYFEIYNLEGKLITKKHTNHLVANSIWELNTDRMQNGHYILYLKSSKINSSIKITIIE